MKRGVWQLDDCVDYPGNARTHPPAQLDLLSKLIKKYGQDQDIVVDEDYVILKGHGRKLAMKLAGMTEASVTQRFGLSESDKRAMRIADNAVALLSGWDNALLRTEVSSLKLSGYEIPLLGFGEAQLVQFMATPQPPSEFQAFGEDIPTNYHCPCGCDFRWSGNPLAGADAAEVKKAKAKRKKAA
jgi:hypothetical protein